MIFLYYLPQLLLLCLAVLCDWHWSQSANENTQKLSDFWNDTRDRSGCSINPARPHLHSVNTFQVYLLLFRNIINEREDERLVLCPFMDWSIFQLSCSPFDMNNIIILASQHTAVKCQQGCLLSPRRTGTHNTPSLLVPDVGVCLQLPYKTLKEGKQVATGQ